MDDASMLARPMPHNQEAEQSVIGSMLIDKDCISKVVEALRPADFFFDNNREIYEAILELFNLDEPVDAVTVGERLMSKDKLDAVGGAQYLYSVAANTPTTANLRQYIDILLDKSLLRRLIGAAGEIQGLAYAGAEDAKTIADRAGGLIFDVLENQDARGFVHIRDVLLSTHDTLAELYQNKGKLTGVPTGIADLDVKLNGLQKSDLILVAARPGMGKTSFVLNMAAHAAIHAKVPVAIFSLEMSAVQLVSRIISSEMFIDSERLRTGELEDEDWDKLAASLGTMGDAPLYIDDSTNITVGEMRAKCRRLKVEKGLGLVVIDYLQLMQGRENSQNRQQEISEISRSLKILAKELDVPVITCSQLSRAPEQRTDHRPMLSDLRESGAIEQDADIVMFLYRDDKYNPDSEKKNIAECIISKFRSGSTGTVEMVWAGQYTRFMDYDPSHAD